MILTRVRDVVRGREAATFSQILADSGAEAPIVQEVLSYWIRKGQISARKTPDPGCPPAARICGGCPMAAGCASPPRRSCEGLTVYRWVGPGLRRRDPIGAAR